MISPTRFGVFFAFWLVIVCVNAGPADVPRNLPGVTTIIDADARTAEGFYLPTDGPDGRNLTAPYQLTSADFSLVSVNMTTFCAGYTVSNATQLPTLVKYIFNSANTTVRFEFLANNTIAPIPCNRTSDCNSSTTFWDTQWPQYKLPNNESIPCAFCYLNRCVGKMALYDNGTVITQPSACPYLTSLEFLAGSSFIEGSVDVWYSASPVSAQTLLDCQIAAETIYGPDGELDQFDQSTNTCYIYATCDATFKRARIFSFSSFVAGVPVPGLYNNVRETSAIGNLNNLPNGTDITCTTAYDCLTSSIFTAAMDAYRQDSYNVVWGKPNVTGTGLAYEDALDAICLNGRCAMIDVLNQFSLGPLGWNDTSMQPEFKCNYQLRNVTVDITANLDLNTTLFNVSRYINPCTYYGTNVSILEVYSPDCPGSIIFDNSTSTYQITVPSNFTVAVTRQPCHLAIRCDVNNTALPYDCSGPSDNTTYTTNVRGAIYDVYYLYNGVFNPVTPPVAPPAGLSNGSIIAIVFSSVVVVVIIIIAAVYTMQMTSGRGGRGYRNVD